MTEAAADNKEAVKEDIKKLMKLIDPEIDESEIKMFFLRISLAMKIAYF